MEKIAIHAFMDGRDTSPVSGINFMKKIEKFIAADKKYKVATLCGRFYAMDRDNRWDRIRLAWNAIVVSKAKHEASNVLEAIENALSLRSSVGHSKSSQINP